MSKLEECVRYECDECGETSFENKRVFEAWGSRRQIGFTVLYRGKGRVREMQKEEWFCTAACLIAWAKQKA